VHKALFLIFLFGTYTAACQEAIVPVFEISLDKPYYQAGDKAILSVTLKNINNDRWYMDDVSVSIKSSAIISYEPLTQGPVTIDINGEKTFTFTFRLKNLSNGNYDITARYAAQFWCAATLVRTQNDEKTISIRIDNSEPSLSLFKTDFEVQEGSPFSLVFVNEGAIAKSARFTISSDASFDWKGSLGYITTSITAPVKINEKPGIYKAYVNMTYANKLGEERKISVPITVRVTAQKKGEMAPASKIVASLTAQKRKATFTDYLPYYAFGLFLILLFSSLLIVVTRLP
jgi:hypothetical protein